MRQQSIANAGDPFNANSDEDSEDESEEEESEGEDDRDLYMQDAAFEKEDMEDFAMDDDTEEVVEVRVSSIFRTAGRSGSDDPYAW